MSLARIGDSASAFEETQTGKSLGPFSRVLAEMRFPRESVIFYIASKPQLH